ncbi:MAG TPA: VOC family protein [Frankiaceae bacterium]|nr:VOC family protein [Frankiaceae bacterium]
MRLQHANVVVPRGLTEEVAAFYENVLGLRRIPKPEVLAGRGGAWFDVDGYAQVHLSERDGAVHRDSHFALVVDAYDETLAALAQNGAQWTEQEDVFGGRRGFTRDPAGNRIEILERAGTLE